MRKTRRNNRKSKNRKSKNRKSRNRKTRYRQSRNKKSYKITRNKRGRGKKSYTERFPDTYCSIPVNTCRLINKQDYPNFNFERCGDYAQLNSSKQYFIRCKNNGTECGRTNKGFNTLGYNWVKKEEEKCKPEEKQTNLKEIQEKQVKAQKIHDSLSNLRKYAENIELYDPKEKRHIRGYSAASFNQPYQSTQSAYRISDPHQKPDLSKSVNLPGYDPTTHKQMFKNLSRQPTKNRDKFLRNRHHQTKKLSPIQENPTQSLRQPGPSLRETPARTPARTSARTSARTLARTPALTPARIPAKPISPTSSGKGYFGADGW